MVLDGYINTFQHALTLDNNCKLKHARYNHSFELVLGGCIITLQHAPTSDNHWKLKHVSTIIMVLGLSCMHVLVDPSSGQYFCKMRGSPERVVSEWCFGPYGSFCLAEASLTNVDVLAPFACGLSAEFSAVELCIARVGMVCF